MKSSGTKRLVHPVVGDLTLGYETLSVNASQGQSLTIYHAEPGSRDADALALLASHAATSAAEAAGGVITFNDYAERTVATPPAPGTPARSGTTRSWS